MASIKEYNVKLKSLKNTVKITKTMKMVAASKLRRAQEAQKDAADYANEVNRLIVQIAGAAEVETHPLLESKPQVKKVLLVLYTSDKGLCGGFNNNLIRDVRLWMKDRPELDVTMSYAGRRGHTYFNKRQEMDTYYEGVTAKPDPMDAKTMSDDVCGAYLADSYDEVYLVYNQFISALAQKPNFEKLLPLQTDVDIPFDSKVVAKDFIAEPPIKELLNHLIPRLVVFKMHYAMLENAAGEHGARMTAMDNATSNANSLIDEYTTRRNRARQAAITTELTEIVAGAEAL